MESIDRIVIIVNQMQIGGVQRLIVDDINEFVRRGIEVHLVTLAKEDAQNTYIQELKIPEVFRHIIEVKRNFDIVGIIKLSLFLRRIKATRVFTNMWLANNVGRLAAWCADVQTIVAFEHSIYDTVKSNKQFFFDRALQHISSKIVAVSHAVRESLLRHGINSKRIEIIPNGMNIERFTLLEKCDKRIRKELSILEDQIIFICVARLQADKNVDLLIHAVEQVPLARLLIVGDGTELINLRKLSEKKGIADRINFLGARLDIPELLSASDCFLFSSGREGFGIVLIEAMASGLPIITSSFAAIGEVVNDERTAICIPNSSVEAFAAAMQLLIDDPILRSEYGAAARKAAQNFTIANHVDRVLSI